MTPSSPEVKGSIRAMLTVPEGAMRLPERRRRSVVLPAPLAGVCQSMFPSDVVRIQRQCVPPISRVRLPGGRLRFTFWRPDEPSGKAYDRYLTSTEGAASSEVPLVLVIE